MLVMDCNMYTSTFTALNNCFLNKMISEGALILFSDWGVNKASPDFSSRKACRLCNGWDLQLVLLLNKSPLCDAYLKEPKHQEYYNLDVYLCKECGFVQINTIVDPEIIYKDYIYVTTSSSGLKKHFDNYAFEVSSVLEIKNSKFIVDIGSNDGTLLEFFKSKNHRILGIEPAEIIANNAEKRGIKTIKKYFDILLAKQMVDQYGYADIITINNLFANIDDLETFTKGLEILLDENGVIVIESSYLLNMVNNMVFDFIYHEHLSYFSILPLIKFFKGFGMQLIRLQEVSTKGGSLRYYWAREDSKWDVNENVKRLIEKERIASIGLKTFEEFQLSINSVKKSLIDYLMSDANKTIVGYGASATSTTLISHFQLSEYINYLVDDNPQKIGTYSPGYHIPVYSSSKLLENTPDIIIILAWRYKKEIMKKLQGIRSRVIGPLPQSEVLNALP